jgi:hypothetical protein
MQQDQASFLYPSLYLGSTFSLSVLFFLLQPCKSRRLFIFLQLVYVQSCTTYLLLFSFFYSIEVEILRTHIRLVGLIAFTLSIREVQVLETYRITKSKYCNSSINSLSFNS